MVVNGTCVTVKNIFHLRSLMEKRTGTKQFSASRTQQSSSSLKCFDISIVGILRPEILADHYIRLLFTLLSPSVCFYRPLKKLVFLQYFGYDLHWIVNICGVVRIMLSLGLTQWLRLWIHFLWQRLKVDPAKSFPLCFAAVWTKY